MNDFPDPVKDIPNPFAVKRGGIEFNRTPSSPPSRWQKRKWRLKAKVSTRRERLALFIAPWLDREWYD